MKSYPVTPTEFSVNLFDKKYYKNDFLFTPDGIGPNPEHHCKQTWVVSKPYIKNYRNAIDIGCRDGEYTHFLQKDFDHVFCFDYRRRKLLIKNIDTSKVTHFKCALGDKNVIMKVSGAGSITSEKMPKEKWYDEEIFTLDQFELSNIDYIKIDVDGFEEKVLIGATQTIIKCNPILVLEQVKGDVSGINYCSTLGYKILEWDKAHRNVIMGKDQ